MKNVFLPEAGILLKTTRVIETRKFMEKRVISTQVQEEDMQTEFSLRPMSLEEYVGQEKIKSTLRVLVKQRFPGLLPMRWVYI